MRKGRTLAASLGIVALLGARVVAQTTTADLDALLVREDSRDLLVLRPWIADPPEAGIWVWPAPAGTQVAVQPAIEVDALRSAVWEGHIPLHRVNAAELRSPCDIEAFLDLALLPAQALGAFDSLAELEASVRREGLPFADADRQQCAFILATDASVAAVGWRHAEAGEVGRDHARSTPLDAIVLAAPGHWTELDLGGEDPRRGCVGRLIAVAARPVVPAPADGDVWQSSLLAGRGAIEAARLAGAYDVDASWCATALDLVRCDGATALHPVLLDPARDLRGPTARTAASWCGLRPGPEPAAALRRMLASRDWTGIEAAFAIWAWARQRTDDAIPVLESWTGSAHPIVRSEALLGLAAVDSASGLGRDLAVLAGFLEPSRESQPTVDWVGSRVVAGAGRADVDTLRAIADQGGGWLEWSVGEHLDSLEHRRPYRPGPNELTAGAWAVAALAAVGEYDAVYCLRDALVSTAILDVANARGPRRGCSLHAGFSSDFWNGYQIVFPDESARLWPTLHRIEVALAERPQVREGVLRIALRDPRLPDVAATVLLASLAAWYPDDTAMAVAILDSATTDRDAYATRFFGVHPGGGAASEVRLPWAAAGAAYVLAQRGEPEPILAALARDPAPALEAELVFALALAAAPDDAAAGAIDAWRAAVDRQPDDAPGRVARLFARGRVNEALTAGHGPHRSYSARFAADFRTRWRR